MTVSMLQGRAGFPGQGNRASSSTGCVTSLDSTSSSFLTRCCSAWPSRFKRELKVPIGCTLQGDDLFLEGLGVSVQAAGARSDQVAARYVDGVLSGERVLSWTSCRRTSGSPPSGCRSSRSASTSRATRRVARGQRRSVHGRLLRAHRAREGAARSVRRLRAAARAAGTWRRTARGRRIPAARAPGIPRQGLARRSARRACRRVRVPEARWTGLRRSGSSRASMCSRCPTVYEEPKGLFLLEAMASGVPVVQPRRGAFPEIVQKTGGGMIVEPDDPDALADALETLLEGSGARRGAGQGRRRGRARTLRRRSDGGRRGSGLRERARGGRSPDDADRRRTSRSRIPRRAASCRSSTASR